jgi:phage terminase large subunit-like protein
MSPERWARRALGLVNRYRADCIVCEVNQGGTLVERVIRQYALNVRIRSVHAAKGKQARAEPVLSLWEQGRAHLVGGFPELCDEMCSWEPDSGQRSPSRLDAMCWGMWELSRPRGATIERLPSPKYLPVFAR